VAGLDTVQRDRRDVEPRGADHVTLLPSTGEDFTADVDRLAGLAPKLTAAGG
jgi:hypothetical protein